MYWHVTTPPATTPVSYAEAKAHLRLDNDDEQELIESYIEAATDFAERSMGRALVTRSIEVSYDPDERTPKWICLPVQPVSWRCEDEEEGEEEGGEEEEPIPNSTSTTYELKRIGTLDFMRFNGGPGPVIVRYRAGYGSAADVPAAIRTAILLHVATLFAQREATADRQHYKVPYGLDAIYAPHKAGGGIG